MAEFMAGNEEVETVLIELPHVDQQNIPEVAEDGNMSIVIELSHVFDEGIRKTTIKNFTGLCEMIDRQEWHVLEFLLDVSGFLDRVETIRPYKDDGRNVILEGLLTATDFNETMQLYLNIYVICSACNSSNTALCVFISLLLSKFTCREGNAVESQTYSYLGLNESYKEVSETPRVLMLLSSVLERSIQRNEKILEASKKKDVVTIFHGLRPPTLSIQQYLQRIFKYSSCSPSCFVVAYIYIQTFLQRTDAYLTSLNVHRLLITSVMVAAKVNDDEYHNNAYFAKVGGVSTAEMNRLEMKFLFSMDFRLHVTVEVFNKYCLQLKREGIGEFQIKPPIPLQKGRSRVPNQVVGGRGAYPVG